jgi:dephospho-CoA kinase
VRGSSHVTHRTAPEQARAARAGAGSIELRERRSASDWGIIAAMTRVVGLTGGIGSGKSTVGAMLRALGATLIDADRIVHALQAPGQPLLEELAAAFGREILDRTGALDRKALGRLVFEDPQARRQLGLIVHPKVGLEMLRQTVAAREARAPLAVADIPLLFEGRREGRDTAGMLGVEGVILAWVPVHIQVERTVARDECTREEALARIRAQVPIDEKRELAEHLIDNSGSREETEQQVRELYGKLVG